MSAETALRVLTLNFNTIPFHAQISESLVLVDNVYACAVCMYKRMYIFVSKESLRLRLLRA